VGRGSIVAAGPHAIGVSLSVTGALRPAGSIRPPGSLSCCVSIVPHGSHLLNDSIAVNGPFSHDASIHPSGSLLVQVYDCSASGFHKMTGKAADMGQNEMDARPSVIGHLHANL